MEKQNKNNPAKKATPQELLFSLEYIKNENNDILKIMGSNKNNLSSLHNVRKLDEKYNVIKQLLEEIKKLIKT